MKTLEILAYIGSIILIVFLVWALVIERWLIRRKTQRLLNRKAKQKTGPRYHEFTYSGHLYFSGDTPYQAHIKYLAFVRDQRKFGAMYHKAQNKKRGNKKTGNNGTT